MMASALPAPELPGQLFLMAESMLCPAAPARIKTVLGSCVAVVLWDRRRGASGINHYLLPYAPSGGSTLRYGDTAIDRLVAAMGRRGSRIEDLEAKLFGGAAVLSLGDAQASVGARNVAIAVERLEQWGIPVVARLTGGTAGLFIELDSASGVVKARRVPALAVP